MTPAKVEMIDNFIIEEPEPTPYQKWEERLDEEMRVQYGVRLHDLPDTDTFAMFLNGKTPKVAAKAVWKAAKNG